MVSLMTALYFGVLEAPDRVSVKPHASPVLHAINHLLGRLDAKYLTTLREYGGLQSYPSRTKDPDPVDYSTGSVGLGATAPIWGALAHRYVAGHFDVPRGGRQIALIGDAELDEGACWEAIADPMVARLGEVMWVVDLNRQSLDRVVPDIAAGRLAAMFEAAGWHTVMVKYGPKLATRPELRARIDAMPNEEYQRLLRADAQELRTRIEVAVDDLDDADAAGHLPRPRRARPAEPDRRLPPGRRGARPPERRLRLHDQGLVAAHRGPPGQPLGAAQPRAVPRARGQAPTRTPTTRGRRSTAPPRSCAARPARGCARARPARRAHRRSRRTSAAGTAAGRRPSRPSGASSSTSTREAPDVAERVVTVSPDVGTSTNLGGWINKAGIWNIGDRIDWFADDTDTLVRWRQSDHGRHIELGIAEVNLVGLLGELGATWSRDGQPLLPVGTIYDPFVSRALEPWSFGIYAGGQSILVGTPSGVTLGPEGGAHQSVITPSIGIEQPGCIAYEPAFGQDFEWCFLHALAQLGKPGGTSAYFRLSTRPIDQDRHTGTREEAIAGGYTLQRNDDAQVTIAVMGALVPEALEAASILGNAEVVCITSADMLFRSFQARDRASATATRTRSTACSPKAARSSASSTGTPTPCRSSEAPASACGSSARPATSSTSTSTTRSTPSQWSAPLWTFSG